MPDQNIEAFYICVYLKNGTPIGHRGGFNTEFPASLHDKLQETDPTPKLKRSGMKDISKNFINTMMGYLEYVPLILQLAPNVSHKMVSESLQAFLEKKCVSCNRNDDRIIYKFNPHDFPSIRRFEENLSAAASTSRSLPRLLTVGLVSSL